MKNFNESDYLEDLYYGPEKDYFDEISEIENGGYDEDFETEEFKNPQLAAEIHQAAQEAGLSDLDYVNQQEFFDEIIDSDPEDGPYIVDIEEREGYSEFVLDNDGNPNLENARPIYDNLVSGTEKGFYGRNCKDNPIEALEDVIEGYDMMVSDAMLGRSTLKGALNLLAKYKDNPNCPKCKKYFEALSMYAEQINAIATEIGMEEFCIDIPGNLALKNEAISFKRPMKESGEKLKLDELVKSDLAQIVVAYRLSDPEKTPIKNSQKVTYSVAYDASKSGLENIMALKDLLRQNGISESALSKLGFRKVAV